MVPWCHATQSCVMDGGWIEAVGVPSIEATSVSSTGTSLTGVDTIPSASRSSWLGSNHRPSDCTELQFELVEGTVQHSPLAFLTSSIEHYCIWDNSLIFNNSLAEFTQN